MANPHRVTFGVFQNDRKDTDKHPDRMGRIEVTETLLREMVDYRKAGKLPVLEVAVWDSTTRNENKPYLYCKAGVSEYWTNKRAEKEAEAKQQPETSGAPTTNWDDDDPFA